MAMHATYSANRVTINFGGVNFSGKGDQDFVTISRNSDRVDIRSGADGHKSVALLADHSATVTYIAFPESDTAKILNIMEQSWRVAEQANVGVAGALPFAMADASGIAIVGATEAIMTKAGDITLGTTSGVQEFTFYLVNPVFAALPSDIAGSVQSTLDKIPKIQLG